MWPGGRSVRWGNRKWLSGPKVEEGKKALPGDWYSLFSFAFQLSSPHYSLRGLALRRAKEMDGVEVRVSLSAIFQEQGERTGYWLSQVPTAETKGHVIIHNWLIYIKLFCYRFFDGLVRYPEISIKALQYRMGLPDKVQALKTFLEKEYL